MVGLDLERECKPEKSRAQSRQSPFTVAFGSRLAVGEHHSGKHPRQERKGLHLGIMAHLDNLDIVGAESHGHGAAGSHQRAYAQRKHQQKGAQ